MIDREDYRFGSAAWADEAGLHTAGLFDGRGLPLGYWGRRVLRLAGDAPLITIGGAGSGKLRDLLAYVLCGGPGMPMLVHDPRGELGALSLPAHARHREHAWFWNPLGLCGLPGHACNPLDILRPGSLSLISDCRFIAEGLIPLSGSANGQYFELRAREWTCDLLIALTERDGGAGFPALMRIVNAIEAAPDIWGAMLEAMLASPHESVRRTAAEMLAKQQDAPKEFGAIMGSIYAALGFLNDPVLLNALDRPDFSLAALCAREPVAKVFLNIPAEFLSIWSPLVRVFFTVTMLHKSRRPEAPRITLVCDEAGQLGRFEALLRAFTYGRGAGIRCWAVFQDVGQIERNFGRTAVQGFLGSAQVRQFFGVRDFETARLVSDMLGTETLEYDDDLRQSAARRPRRQVTAALLNGADPFAAAHDYAHHAFGEHHRTKQARRLMTPDEVLAMPEDRQILFISGRNLRPVLACKHPYFTRREMAGLYLANPYHPPTHSVPVATRFGMRRAAVLTEPVPPALASFPQYRNGTWSYVRGYRPL